MGKANRNEIAWHESQPARSDNRFELSCESNSMAFVNEYISEEDIKKYGIEEIWLRYHAAYGGTSKPPGFRFQWTIDRARDIYFMQVGGGGRDEIDLAIWILDWQGKKTRVDLAKTSDGSMSFSERPYRIVWELRNSPAMDSMSRGELLAVIREALVGYGYGGVREQIPETVVNFKF